MSNPIILAYTIGIVTKGFEKYPCDLWVDPQGNPTRKQEDAKVYTDKLVADYLVVDLPKAKVDPIVAEVDFDILAMGLAHYYNTKKVFGRHKVTVVDMHPIVSDYMRGMDEPVTLEAIAEHYKESIKINFN